MRATKRPARAPATPSSTSSCARGVSGARAPGRRCAFDVGRGHPARRTLDPFARTPLKPFLRQQLERYPVRLQELDFFLQQPEVAQDMDRLRALTREHAEVSDVAGQYQRFREHEAQ